MKIKWMHISDIHFGYDSYYTGRMREKFLIEIKKPEYAGTHYLFLTGDLCFGKTNGKKYPDEISAHIKEIQNILDICPKNTFIVPGNHDVVRSDARSFVIEGAKKAYSGGRIDGSVLECLEKGLIPFNALLTEICGECRKNFHYVIDAGLINIIHIDTSLMSYEDGEKGSLFVGLSLLRNALECIDDTKPAIALAHHDIYYMRNDEIRELSSLLKEKGTVLYLCGHDHTTTVRENQEGSNCKLWECVCGTFMDESKYLHKTSMSFLTGEIDTCTKSGFIKARELQGECWVPVNSHPFKNDDLNGKYFFPKPELYPDVTVAYDILEKDACDKYLNYLKREAVCERLSLDIECGSKLAIENIFVPLRFSSRRSSNLPNIIPNDGLFRYVILSDPGGGKTTFIKRIVSAYGLNRLKDIDDRLPARELFPVWIKCRQLKENAVLPISDMISKIPLISGFSTDNSSCAAFSKIVSSHLQKGTALVLFDGLDEISDSHREAFIENLEKFIFENPKVNLILTSRIAGYKQIAQFTHFNIIPFDNNAVTQMTSKWCAIVSNHCDTITDDYATELNKKMNGDEILQLAHTPSLLTTLLLVYHRTKELPTNRTLLYKEAVNVLSESSSKFGLNQNEVLTVLAYLAYALMFEKKSTQRIGKNELIQIFKQAMNDLPQTFSCAAPDTVADAFIKYIEEGTGVLVQRGYSASEDEYEFMHFTFQEYMAAYAVSNKCYYKAKKPSISDCFEEKWEKEDLREVIIFTSAMADELGAKEIVGKLLELHDRVGSKLAIDRDKRVSYISNLLMQIVANESPVEQNYRKNIYYKCYYNGMSEPSQFQGIQAIFNSKFREEFENSVNSFSQKRKVDRYGVKTVIELLELNKKISNFSPYSYYLDHNVNTLDAVRILDLALWLGGNWIENEVFEDYWRTYNYLKGLCSGTDNKVAYSALVALDSLMYCTNHVDISDEELLRYTLKFIKIRPPCMVIANRFAINTDTLLFLKGIRLSPSQKSVLQKAFNSETRKNNLLGYFWYGLLFGAWDVGDIVQKADEFLTRADYLDFDDKLKISDRLRRYVSIRLNSPNEDESSKEKLREFQQELSVFKFGKALKMADYVSM